MKKSRFQMMVVLIFLSFLGLVGCGHDSTTNEKGGIIQEKETESVAGTENDEMMAENNEMVTENSGVEEENEDNPQGVTVHIREPQYTTEKNLCGPQDIVNKDGITYQILSWEKTKEFGNRNTETLADWIGDLLDENNNFTGGEFYVFVTMKITNETEETVIVDRTPGYVVLIDENLQVYTIGNDRVYIDEYWYGGDEKSVFYYELKPGESITCEFAHILWDDGIDIEGTMYYWVRFMNPASEPSNRFILLEE